MAAVVRYAAQQPFATASDEPVNVTLTVNSGVSFTLEDDLAPVVQTDDGRPGAHGDLFGHHRWTLRLASAVCTHTAMEVRTGGRRWRQELGRAGSLTPIEDHGPSGAVGTTVTFTLDLDYFAAGSSVPAEAAELWPDVHIENSERARHTEQPAGADAPPGSLTVIDRRPLPRR
jgi:hypothetical protein